MGDHSRRRLPPLAGESGEDHISGLPDELLHVILLHLDSVAAAARTSVLSHRWRRVWTFLPQLILSPEDEDDGSEEEDKESEEYDEEGSEEDDEGQEEDEDEGGSEEDDEDQEEEDEGASEEDDEDQEEEDVGGSEENDEDQEEEDEEGSEEDDESQEEEDEGSEEKHEGLEQASSFADTVDAVLAASAAPTIELLSICVPGVVTAQRIAPWLHFASERVTGEISIYLTGAEMVELPACGITAKIDLNLVYSCKLRSTGGVFRVLTCLEISFACMDAKELTDLVSTRCPHLKNLSLIVKLAADSDVSIHSDSLHYLFFCIKNAQRLEVIAPRLEELSLFSKGIDEIHISAPKLANLILNDDYNPRRHLFTDVCSRFRLLEVGLQSTITPLMKQFNQVDELRLNISIPWGTAGYKSFMNLTNCLSKCETLRISLEWNRHGLVPAILHLLRCCNSIKKLSIDLTWNDCVPPLRYSCPLDCPCRLAEGRKIDDIALFSLEEVQIAHFFGSQEEMEFVEQLSRCNAPVLKNLGIFGKTRNSLLTRKVREKIRCLCRPDFNVQFYREVCYTAGGFSEVRVRLD